MPPRHRVVRWSAILLAGAVLAAACSSGDDGAADETADATSGTVSEGTASDDASDDPAAAGGAETLTRFRYPPAPEAPAADVANDEAAEVIDQLNERLLEQAFDFVLLAELGEVGDARHAWYVTDLLRFFRGDEGLQLVNVFERLTGVELANDPDAELSPWLSATNHLIAWDTPEYPGYVDDKAGIFLLVEPGWTPFFADDDATIDWRYVSWGGVPIDDRELGDPNPCEGGCIPALDDPAVTPADEGDWYPDDRIVFGIVEGDEALAIPLNIAEIHEMFNLTLGGRRLGIPYCTLCGSAQAYYTDDTGAAEVPVLRTSGLLSRSNKVMYDLNTQSVFDTFTGAAVSGPLREEGIVLEETTVVRSTWAEWKRQYPDTSIIAEDGGIGRTYELDPLGGRDDDGPIFPIGAADDRLGEQDLVVGVIAPDGTPVAFPSDAASSTLDADGVVEAEGVTLMSSGDGLVAVDAAGDPIAAHEAFWFAWSQFHPDTVVWEG